MANLLESAARWVLRDQMREANPTVESALTDTWSESFGGSGTIGADNALLYDDIGWIRTTMTEGLNTGDINPVDRQLVVRRARVYAVRDAFCRQAIRLNTTYCIGRGLSIKARNYKQGETEQEVAALQADADAFWEHPDNTPVFSTEAQSINSDRLNIDGEIFFLLIPPVQSRATNDTYDAGDEDNVTRVRVISDCLQVETILFNPEDDSEPWYYLRRWIQGGENKAVLYPDHRLFFKGNLDENGVLHLPPVPEGPGYNTAGATVDATKFVYHAKVCSIGMRGNSYLGPAMDWSKVNRQYLEDRATISRAHARFAWKRMIKGPASAVAAFGRKAASSVGISGQPIPSPAGSTLNVNSGLDWEPVNAQDGGKNAYIESRNFRLMFYAAVGFAEHYFGDGSNGTRATSVSMERPTQMMLEAYQMIWKGTYEALFAFHLAAIGRDYDAHAVWVDAPQIAEDDTAALVNSALALIAVLPEFDIDEMLIRILNAFQIDDPQDVLVKIRQRQKELFEQNLELVYATAGLDQAQTMDTQNSTTNPLTGEVSGDNQHQMAALQKIVSMLTASSDPTRMPGPAKAPQFASGQKGASLAIRKPSPPKTRLTDPIKNT